jgi:bifunctional DNA-binding transcriptional regulator/antitoxin component of YhaV-PrlF toxin-antitoxin module
MTNEDRSYTKIGAKGQVVIAKHLREKYALVPGKQVEQIDNKGGVLIRLAPLVEDWEQLSTKVGKRWPKRVSSVEAVREEREK